MTNEGPIHVAKYCGACGNGLVATAVVCPNCGAPQPSSTSSFGTGVGAPKTKTTAILLAIFLSFWTWIYTYKKDMWKFWVGLVTAIALGIFTAGIGAALVWVWAIVDVAIKPDEYYQNFPN